MGFRAIVPSLGKWGRGFFPITTLLNTNPLSDRPRVSGQFSMGGDQTLQLSPPNINTRNQCLVLSRIRALHHLTVSLVFYQGRRFDIKPSAQSDPFKFSWFLEVFEQSIIWSMLNKSHEINSQFSNQFLNLWVPTLARCKWSFLFYLFFFLLIKNKSAYSRFNFLSFSIFIYIS